MSDAAEGRKALVRTTLLHALVSVGPSLGTYYALRIAGQSEVHALIAATVVAGVQVLTKVVGNRKLDVISGFLMLNFGLSLVIAVATDDARTAQASNTIPGLLISVFFIGSALTGKPFTELVVDKVRPGRLDELAAEQNWTDEDFCTYHRMHKRVSLWAGVVSLMLSMMSLVIIYSFSVDVAQAVNQIYSLVTTTALIIGIIVVIRRRLQQIGSLVGQRRPAPQG